MEMDKEIHMKLYDGGIILVLLLMAAMVGWSQTAIELEVQKKDAEV